MGPGDTRGLEDSSVAVNGKDLREDIGAKDIQLTHHGFEEPPQVKRKENKSC